MPTVDGICRVLDALFPANLAAEWDNTGLLLGEAGSEVRRVLTCLTLSPDVAEEAIRSNAQLIVTHHPILFKPLKNLSSQNREGKLLLQLIRAGIAVYSPHTRFDNAKEGINEWIARQLGLQQIQPLRVSKLADRSKIVVFVPESDLPAVSKALFDAGAGAIGEYSECSFRTPGLGTFRGSDNSNPTVGTKNVTETAPEIRLEVICLNRLLEAAVGAMLKAHSYEEPAYDVFPLQILDPRGGEGRIGIFPKKIALEEVAGAAKKVFGVSHLQIVGEDKAEFRKVAIACGAAGEFLYDAIRKRADLFITGELRFHEALHARTSDIAVLMPGHYASERPAVEWLARLLGERFPGLNVEASRCERDPIRVV